jgi:non-specific serine/threonine protein kinase/serine/threonine-protein kinase
MSERWLRLKELFEGALALAPERRGDWLREACPDETLRLEVVSLVASHERAGGFLEQPALEGGLVEAEPPAHDDLSGRLVGAYRVLDLVGRGGMGAVYRARRADEAYEQVVALKVVKRGMDTEFVLARFQAERRILARLEHPHIARLLDAGTTADGRPYFVMEYVEGERIDRWAEARGLDTPGRLRLFLDVCSAVAHAHAGLVIHRDLKPANVLVRSDGMAKLLDFGVAKLLEPGTAEPTATGLVMMTPEYASPEQVRGEPVTTATDVYSLGVVLYELLSGRRPYTLTRRAPAELARAVCEQEPAELPASVPSDLSAVVRMALRKEPERRYSSVEQLAADVRGFLESRPVQARRDTVAYRARKFVRRHRVGVGAAVLLAVTLLGGIGATLWQARVARAERARAERRFQDVRQVANSFLFEFHDSIAGLSGATRARELVVRRGLSFLDGLAREAAGDASLQRELALAYQRMATIQSADGMANLGQTSAALDSLRKALEIQRGLLAAGASDPGLQAETLATANLLGDALVRAGETAAAEQAYRDAQQAASALHHADPAALGARLDLVRAHRNVGWAQELRGDMAGAVRSNQEAVALVEPVATAAGARRDARLELVKTYRGLGGTLQATGDLAGARDRFARALALAEVLAAAEPDDALLRRQVAFCHERLGLALLESAQPQAALERLRGALAAYQRLAAGDPADAEAARDVSVAHGMIGRALLESGKTQEALGTYARAVALAEELAGRAPDNVELKLDVVVHHHSLAGALKAAGDLKGAVASGRRALALLQAIAAGDPGNAANRERLAEANGLLGELHGLLRQSEDARRHYRAALAELEPLVAADPANVPAAAGLARALAALGSLGLAGPGRPGPEACRQAQPQLARALSVWDGLEARGALPPGDANPRQAARRQADGCAPGHAVAAAGSR